MNRPVITIKPPSDHLSEIVLLGLIAGGVVWLLGKVVDKAVPGWDVAACLLVLQGIISAIKERWTQRSVDRMGQQLAGSSPTADAPAPANAQAAADQVADAAADKADEIAGEGK
jgi:hypothetical protein